MNAEDKIVEQFDMNRIQKEAKLPIICVYKQPSDYPEKYVARLWDINVPTSVIATAATLEEIRQKIPAHMARMNRCEQDDPAIVEIWL